MLTKKGYMPTQREKTAVYTHKKTADGREIRYSRAKFRGFGVMDKDQFPMPDFTKANKRLNEFDILLKKQGVNINDTKWREKRLQEDQVYDKE